MTLPRAWICLFVAAAWCGAGLQARDQQPPRLVLLDDGVELDAALAARTPPHDIAVRVAGLTLPDADPTKARLLILAEIAGAEAGLSAEATAGLQVVKAGVTTSPFLLASVAYVVEDERGQVRARELRRRELRPTASGTSMFSEIVTLAPGTYTLKLAAMRNSKVGVAQGAVAVRVWSVSDVRFGDLAVGESAGEDVGSSASVDRRVGGERLVASLGCAVAGPLLPDGMAMSVEVARDGTGPAMMSAPAALLTSADAQAPSQRILQAAMDVRALPPGTYVARAVVSVGGKEAARVTAPFTRARATSTPAPPAAVRAPDTPRPSSATAALVPGASFRAEEVLDAAVLRPFLDDLAVHAAGAAKPAIEQARAGRFAEAAQAAASADPNGPAAPFLQGLSLFSQKQLQAASESFRETLRAAPDFFVGAFYIGACYAAGGRDPQAVNAWQTSLVGLEQYPIVFRLLAEALTRMGQPDRALETLDEATGKWPGDADMRLRTARAALDAKRYDRVFALVDGDMKGQPAADLLFAGIQAVYEQATQRADPPGDEAIARARRYRDAYAAAGGRRQALVAEWLAALERKK
jgi:tetratricopeptide (TPR) repeat protein